MASRENLAPVAPAGMPRSTVTSSLVRVTPLPAPLPCDRAILETVTQAAFGQRRKMLRQSLRSLGGDTAALLAAAGLDPTARAEDISVAGFGALAFMALMEWTVVHLPVAPGWTGQPAYERVFGSGWRIIIASMTAFFVGDFLNSVVLAKMKIWTRGRYLWTRTIGSTVIGEGTDSLIFYPLAFYGLADWPANALLKVMLSQFVLKVGWEVVLTPVTYAVVGWLKRREGVEVFDVGTNFTPFSARV